VELRQMRTTNAASRVERTQGTPIYQRIVVKLSGESLSGPEEFGIHAETIQGIAREVNDVRDLGVEVAIMVGGGNIFRGTRQKELAIDRATGDYMGMLATVLNGLALQDALEKVGCHTRLMSAIEMHEVAEPFIRRRPGEGGERQDVREDHLPRRAAKGPFGDGLDGDLAVHGQQNADRGVQHEQARQFEARGRGRAGRIDGRGRMKREGRRRMCR
jgi:Amino acid kinase family